MLFCAAADDFTYSGDEICFHYYSANSFELHYHDYWEIFVVTEGSVIHEINGEKFTLKKGDCFLVRPNDAHSFSQIGDSNCRHLNIMINADFLKKLMSNININLFYQFLNYKPYLFVQLSDEDYKQCSRLIERFYFSYNSPYDNLAVKFFILNIIDLFYYRVVSLSDQTLNYPEWFRSILTLMCSPKYISMKIEDLCVDLNYSHSYLNKLFKRFTKTTMIDYFTNIKLDYACNLLLTTNYTVLNISELIGYSSLSHFNRIFKKRFNIAPRTYRNNKGILCAQSTPE